MLDDLAREVALFSRALLPDESRSVVDKLCAGEPRQW
jgi:hypothetical protein